MHLGGGFGRRLPGYFNFLTYAVKTAMAMPGVPVKLIFTREEDMQHDYYRPNVLSDFKAALDKSRHAARPGSTTTRPRTRPIPQAHIPYGIAEPGDRDGQGHDAMCRPGPWRSVEASWHGFFIESFVDELAHAAGADPVAYRQALLKDRPRHLAVLETRGTGSRAGARRCRPRQARGVAIFECFQTIVAEVAEIEVGRRRHADDPAHHGGRRCRHGGQS